MLHSTYGYRGAEVVRALRSFAGLPTVTVEDAARVATALDLTEKGMDFADALHPGGSAHCEGFATFDRKARQGRESGRSQGRTGSMNGAGARSRAIRSPARQPQSLLAPSSC